LQAGLERPVKGTDICKTEERESLTGGLFESYQKIDRLRLASGGDHRRLVLLRDYSCEWSAPGVEYREVRRITGKSLRARPRSRNSRQKRGDNARVNFSKSRHARAKKIWNKGCV